MAQIQNLVEERRGNGRELKGNEGKGKEEEVTYTNNTAPIQQKVTNSNELYYSSTFC